jgi:NAD(P)-dependent dehydrogenase (short-subunit alcohol dehydrogenase family)
MQIDQSIALVTGAGSGLGRAAVDMLLAAGARVAAVDLAAPSPSPSPAPAPLTSPSTAPSADSAVDGRAAAADRLLPLAADVSDAEALEAAFAQVRDRWGAPTILVNCAGVLGPARVFRTDRASGRLLPRDLESFRRVIDINLVGTFNAVRLFAAGLDAASRESRAATGERGSVDDERGVIINTASVAAFEALSGQAAYGASKAGVASMTLPLARELGRIGIRVLAVAPGTFATGMFTDIPEHTRRVLLADVPFPPRAGQPPEFAHLVRALIENPMMNGTVVRIDGGVRMREPQRANDTAAQGASA